MEKPQILPLVNVDDSNLHNIGPRGRYLSLTVPTAQDGYHHLPGALVLSGAYSILIESNGFQELIAQMDSLGSDQTQQWYRLGSDLRTQIMATDLPEELSTHLLEGYFALFPDGKPESVSLFSSPLWSRDRDMGFWGLHDDCLNVLGKEEFIQAVKKCYASMFSDRSLSYLKYNGIKVRELEMGIVIQVMPKWDCLVSGTALSQDPDTAFKDVVVINSAKGFPEPLCSGRIVPDEYTVFKSTMGEDRMPILDRELGSKSLECAAELQVGGGGIIREASRHERNRFSLNNDGVMAVATASVQLEKKLATIRDRDDSVRVDWYLEPNSGEVYITRVEPLNDLGTACFRIVDFQSSDRNTLGHGLAIGRGVARGMVSTYYDQESPEQIYVSEDADLQWLNHLGKVRGVVSPRGGRLCNSAFMVRELGLLGVMACGEVFDMMEEGDEITLDCSYGEIGAIYSSALDFSLTELEFDENLPFLDRLQVNAYDPHKSWDMARIPHGGIGLLGLEHILSSRIRVHPMAFIKHRMLNDVGLSDRVCSISRGYCTEENFFIEKLAESISRLSASVYPKSTMVRFSDFQSDGYRELLGGIYFEPEEANPLVGLRGASRYYSPMYREAFAMECQAIARARSLKGLTNISVVIPFCRTVEELFKVLEIMKENGLERGKDGLKVFLMTELPSNIVLAKDFAKHVDGFSIGTDDLSQLCLGMDRGSETLAGIADETDDSLSQMIRSVMSDAREYGVQVSVCGEAASDIPDYARVLLEQGLDTVSVTTDALLRMGHRVKVGEMAA